MTNTETLQSPFRFKKTAILIGAIIAVSMAAAYTVTSHPMSLAASGAIAADGKLGVYSDAACTQPTHSLSWSNVTPSAALTQIVYIKNLSNEPLMLSLQVSSWQPTEASTYLHLAWDSEGVSVGVNGQQKACLTLTADSGAPNVSFSFSLTVTGTG